MAELTWYISAKPVEGNNTGGSGGENGENATPNQESTSKAQNQSLARSSAQIVAVTAAKRTASYLISNVGKYSGSTRLQTTINNVMKVGGYAVAFAVNPALGAITVAADAITTAVDNWWEDKWNNARSNQAKARAGEGVGRRV